MLNFKQDILAQAAGEPIQGIVIASPESYELQDGPDGGPPYGIPLDARDRVLAWEDAAPLLDFHYDNGFGAPGCPAITAWTRNRVIFVSTYDGATSVTYVPRRPQRHRPTMPGGG